MKTIADIRNDVKYLVSLYQKFIPMLPIYSFNDHHPYGIKAHTRSVSWLLESFITQHTRLYCNKLGVSNVEWDFPDTSLHDSSFVENSKLIEFFINIKVHDINKKDSKNDIAAVEKLFNQYSKCSAYNIYYVCIGFEWGKNCIQLCKDYIHVFSPQFMQVYINPRNDKIQAFYNHTPILRTREEFLSKIRPAVDRIKV